MRTDGQGTCFTELTPAVDKAVQASLHKRDPRDAGRYGYYERTVPLAGMRAVYEHRPLDRASLGRLSPARTLADLAVEAAGIGYPASPG